MTADPFDSSRWIDVTLAPDEIAEAFVITGRRSGNSSRGSFRRRFSIGKSDPVVAIGRDVNGTGGEIGTARHFNLYMSPCSGIYHGPDLVGRNGAPLQIRTRSNHGDDLCIRPDDPDDHWYIHVTGCLPNYRIHGRILGKVGKDPRWEGHSGGDLVYYVPATELLPFT